MSSVLLTRRVLAACVIAATTLTVAVSGAPARPADSAHSAQKVLHRPLPVLPDGALEVQGAHGQTARPVRPVQAGDLPPGPRATPSARTTRGSRTRRRTSSVTASRAGRCSSRATSRSATSSRTACACASCAPCGCACPRPSPRPIPSEEIPKLDHYQCYAVKPLSRFKERDVRLEDQFELVKGHVGKAFMLCNPVSKNGGEILNSRDHLVCHPRLAKRVRSPQGLDHQPVRAEGPRRRSGARACASRR